MLHFLSLAVDLSESTACIELLRGGVRAAGFMFDRVSSFMIGDVFHDIN
jgi:hypothetical protein